MSGLFVNKTGKHFGLKDRYFSPYTFHILSCIDHTFSPHVHFICLFYFFHVHSLFHVYFMCLMLLSPYTFYLLIILVLTPYPLPSSHYCGVFYFTHFSFRQQDVQKLVRKGAGKEELTKNYALYFLKFKIPRTLHILYFNQYKQLMILVQVLIPFFLMYCACVHILGRGGVSVYVAL